MYLRCICNSSAEKTTGGMREMTKAETMTEAGTGGSGSKGHVIWSIVKEQDTSVIDIEIEVIGRVRGESGSGVGTGICFVCH